MLTAADRDSSPPRSPPAAQPSFEGHSEPIRGQVARADRGQLLAPGLPGRARRSCACSSSPLGLRRRRPPRPAGRPPPPRTGRCCAVMKRLFALALSDPAHGADRPLRRRRPPLDGRRQHLGLQLPLRRRHQPLVDARLRQGDRHQPDREPLRLGLARLAARRRAVRRPLARRRGHDPRRRRGGQGLRAARRAGSGAAPGRRRPATTSTSRATAARACPRSSSPSAARLRPLDGGRRRASSTRWSTPTAPTSRRWMPWAAEQTLDEGTLEFIREPIAPARGRTTASRSRSSSTAPIAGVFGYHELDRENRSTRDRLLARASATRAAGW